VVDRTPEVHPLTGDPDHHFVQVPRGLFEPAAVLETGGNPGRPEAVVAELGGDVGGRRAPADHAPDVGSRSARAAAVASLRNRPPTEPHANTHQAFLYK
jgi:hypothetical protein